MEQNWDKLLGKWNKKDSKENRKRTLSIIKPDAVAKNVVGKILDRFESAGLRIAATKKLQLSKADAEAFYAVHSARPFFKDLVELWLVGQLLFLF